MNLLSRRLAFAALTVFFAAESAVAQDFRTQRSTTEGATTDQTTIQSPIQSPRGVTIINAPGAPGAARPLEPGAQAPTAAPPPLERNEFQEFILQTTGKDLPLFGAELFRNVPTTFAPVENIPVTADYVIGPGDEVQIRAWGQIDVDFRTVVDRTGTINVPRVGQINVAGIKYQDLTPYLRTAFGRVFRNFELTANLGQLRSIQIFMVGQARRPGSYTVSSLSTLVNAIFAAGGPTSTGSMRAIQLKRANRVVSELDLYDLLINGDKSKDVPLLPGDVIYFPPVGPLVGINGSVNVPAVFELKANTTLADLLRWAGGLSTSAQGQKVTVERIEDRKIRKVEEFSLDNAGMKRGIRDGDLVTVNSLTARFDNAVTLRGNVAQPARFPWREGLRVRDVIPEKEALLTRDYWLRRNRLDRPQAQATPLDTNGQAAAGARQRQLAVAPSGISSQVTPTETLVLNDVGRVIGEVNWDYAAIERMSREDLSTTLVPFNLGKAVLENDPQNNLQLRPGDVIVIFSKEDIRVPEAKRTRYVRFEGEFNAAGVYNVAPGETLRQLVTRLGGLTPSAYLFGAEFTRESTRAQQQQRLQETLDRMEQDIQRRAATRAQGALSPEDAASVAQAAESQRALIARLRTLKPTGRIVLELPEDAQLRDLPDLELEDGDRFIVPSRPSMVSVFGSVYNENAFIYKADKRLADYLAQAGGPTRDADSGSIYLIRADGSVISKRQSGILTSSLEGARLMPGDTIVVPEEFDKTTFSKNLKDWSQILYQFGLGAAAIQVLRN